MPHSPVKTRTAEFFTDEHEILHITMLEDVLIDEFDVYDNLLVIRNMTGGKSVLKLTDARAGGWKMTEAAKEITKQKTDPSKTIARAVLITSGIARKIQNLFSFFNSKQTPQKYFTDREEAINWLKSLEK